MTEPVRSVIPTTIEQGKALGTALKDLGTWVESCFGLTVQDFSSCIFNLTSSVTLRWAGRTQEVRLGQVLISSGQAVGAGYARSKMRS